MTTYYVGSGGNNANAGTSWALRRLTLASIDTLVSAGDVVYVGPGVYREAVTNAASGSSGSPITFIADVTGANTDGVGGLVRWTGSDDDATITRSSCLTMNGFSYRTYRGFHFDGATTLVLIGGSGNAILEDCVFANGRKPVYVTDASNVTIRRCRFLFFTDKGIHIDPATAQSNKNGLVENCLFLAGGRDHAAIFVNQTGGWTVKNCTFINTRAAVEIGTVLTAGQTITVNNCILQSGAYGLKANSTTEITEDYNNLYGNSTDRSNVTAGAHSTTSIPMYEVPLAYSGIAFPFPAPLPGSLMTVSALARKAGTSTSTEDLFGLSRPSTDSKKSWGALQVIDKVREATTVRTGQSIKLSDAGRVQFIVPVTNVSTTISVYCYREANYAGTNPQMIIKQPGQSDNTQTDAGSASSWNQLTATLTPAASPPYVIVEIVSNNAATSGSYAAYFDDLQVT